MNNISTDLAENTKIFKEVGSGDKGLGIQAMVRYIDLKLALSEENFIGSKKRLLEQFLEDELLAKYDNVGIRFGEEVAFTDEELAGAAARRIDAPMPGPASPAATVSLSSRSPSAAVQV